MKLKENDMVCWLCGKSYEEWENPNYCRGCRGGEFNIRRKHFKYNQKQT